ncbi:MAG TPA: SpoIVB peptidase S55 domain-containing protein [Polyangia bacterium]
MTRAPRMLAAVFALAVGLGAMSTVTAAPNAQPAPASAAPKLPVAKPTPTKAAPRPAAESSKTLTRALIPGGPAPRIMPVSEIRPGMVGEGLTVFSGTKPEPFKVRVVSVVHNFLPQQDIILVKAEDPRVAFSGIAAGMSGSPVYIDGRLIGAVAYAWSFAKEPLAGVTPIEAMLSERKRPRRSTREGIESGDLVNGPAPGIAPAEPVSVGGAATTGAVLGAASPEVSEPWVNQPPSPGGAVAAGGLGGSAGRAQLLPVSVPLSVSGLSGPALASLEEALSPYGMLPVRAGGGGGSRVPDNEQARLGPGSAVGVLLIRGDMNATAIGTVTWVGGNQVLAFGHPMFGAGEVSLPLVTGEVHTFISSQASSFKLATPLVEVGTVVQDRQSCIVADLGLRAPMLPVSVKVSAPGAQPRTFRAEIARTKRLAPALAMAVLSTAIAGAEPDQKDMVVTLGTRIGLRGLPAVEMRDETFSGDGLSTRVLASFRGVRAMSDLTNNPFTPVSIESVEFEVGVQFRRDYAEIVDVALPGDAVEAGSRIPLKVTLRPYAGAEYTETISVPIPQQLAGQQVRLEVSSGALVRPEIARPEDLAGYITAMTTYYTAASIVVSLSLPDGGASLRGRLVPNLPPSALDTLRTARGTRRADTYQLADRVVFPSSRPVAGRQDLTIEVRPDPLGRPH